MEEEEGNQKDCQMRGLSDYQNENTVNQGWKAGSASAGGGEREFIVEHVNFEVPVKQPRIFVESVSGVGG